jgi:hypothetical protein
MSKIFCFKIFTCAMFFASTHAIAEPRGDATVCKLLQKEKEAVAYLVDQQGAVSKGPINFGRFAYTYSKDESFIVPTKYKIIVSPARLQLTSCPVGCLVLTPVPSICPHSKTYAIGLTVRDRPEYDSDRTWLPYKMDSATRILSVRDPESPYDVDLEYRFEARIIGEFYDPKLRK